MIKPIFPSYEEQAKNKFRPPVSAVDIVKFFREKAKELAEQASKEALTAEDEDLVEIPAVLEEVPTCKITKEVQDYIASQKVTRKVKFINVHCTGTKMNATVAGILRGWKAQGWNNPGYDILILPDGSVTFMTNLDIVTNGVKGVNSISWNVSTIGGVSDDGKFVDTRTPEQKDSLHTVVKALSDLAFSLWNSRPEVKGHRDHPNVKKACPCYAAIPEFEYLKS
jgi:N-acetylmuramoyl-L-alanine amidase